MSVLQNHRFVYTFPSIDRDGAGNVDLAWQGGVEPFDQDLSLSTNPRVHAVQSAADAFTVDECRRLIAIGDAMPKLGGLVEEDHRERYRVSEVAWIAQRPDTHWLYHKLAVLFDAVNTQFGFELLGLIDPPQYTVYSAAQHFDWHIDVGTGAASVRKLSLTVQLSDGSEYEGGDLEFVGTRGPAGSRAIGSATVFPSFLGHRVTPIRSGVRRSLVAWACGPSFR